MPHPLLYGNTKTAGKREREEETQPSTIPGIYKRRLFVHPIEGHEGEIIVKERQSASTVTNLMTPGEGHWHAFQLEKYMRKSTRELERILIEDYPEPSQKRKGSEAFDLLHPVLETMATDLMLEEGATSCEVDFEKEGTT